MILRCVCISNHHGVCVCVLETEPIRIPEKLYLNGMNLIWDANITKQCYWSTVEMLLVSHPDPFLGLDHHPHPVSCYEYWQLMAIASFLSWEFLWPRTTFSEIHMRFCTSILILKCSKSMTPLTKVFNNLSPFSQRRHYCLVTFMF